jgi:hypothetical protein
MASALLRPLLLGSGMTADLHDNGCRSANVFPVGVAFVARQKQRYAHVTVQNTTQIRT